MLGVGKWVVRFEYKQGSPPAVLADWLEALRTIVLWTSTAVYFLD